MGGILHPTVKGIYDGRIKGLNSYVHITQYILNNGIKESKIPKPYTSPGIEYYIGFGTGYELGQKIRALLENDTSSKMLLNEKIECFTFLLAKQEICREDLTQVFLDNIKYWEEYKIQKTTINDLEILLKENKIQRVVDKLFLHYKSNFNLKSLKEFYPIYQNLKELRKEKKKNKKYDTLKELEEIKRELQKWINHNTQQLASNKVLLAYTLHWKVYASNKTRANCKLAALIKN